MVARVFVYLFQFLVYTLLLWMGWHYAGLELPGPVAAPWLWLLVTLAPLIPWHGGGDGGFWFDGDCGDSGD